MSKWVEVSVVKHHSYLVELSDDEESEEAFEAINETVFGGFDEMSIESENLTEEQVEAMKHSFDRDKKLSLP